jgi:two-component system chemotaxis sensor kinase CheA
MPTPVVEEKFEIFAPMPLPEEEHEPEHAPEPVAERRPSPSAKPAQNAVEAMAAKAESASAVTATIRVDLDRVDRMIDLVGELVINEAMLSQRVLEAGIARTSDVAMALEELEHLTREIQDSVMAIRAQPVRSVFQRMPRLVREVAAQTGKQVRLVTEGEGTEVDKTVIERIADPLTHMIRNAIDHGLESPEKRKAAGKPAEGTVRLTALHRSGRIVLEVADDGGGINRARVKEKAIENGLIAPDAILSDEEIDNLIFLPGFSTASTISDISGRGVGMDVVRQSVQALGGRISITSRPGLGSTFTLSLPLTLAVLDGMVVAATGHTLIIPLGAIVETLKPRAADVFPLDNDIRVLALRGGYVPMVDVAMSLGYSNEPLEAEAAVALLVECEGGNRAVLMVDAIHGQRQVVIKSLEANYRAVPGIAAATVMGDGRVALILDVDAVVSHTRADAARPELSLSEAR